MTMKYQIRIKISDCSVVLLNEKRTKIHSGSGLCPLVLFFQSLWFEVIDQITFSRCDFLFSIQHALANRLKLSNLGIGPILKLLLEGLSSFGIFLVQEHWRERFWSI